MYLQYRDIVIFPAFDEEKYEQAEAKITILKANTTYEPKENMTYIKCLDYDFKSKIRDIYASCHVKYQQSKTKEVIETTFIAPNKKGKVLEIKEQVENVAEAERLAKKRLREKNKEEIIGSFTMIGNFNGEVNIISLLVNGEIPQQEMLTLIDETVNDKKVRPLTDKVLIKKTTIVNYDIELKYYISRENESMATSIQEKIEKAIDSFVLWQKSKLGRDINPSELISRIIMAGAKRVEITSPQYTKIEPTQIAIL